MPNGQTDIFSIDRDFLVKLMAESDSVTLRCIKLGAGDWKDYSAEKALDLVKNTPKEDIGVEELHGEDYWVHALSEESRYLVEIVPGSNLYGELRKYHMELSK